MQQGACEKLLSVKINFRNGLLRGEIVGAAAGLICRVEHAHPDITQVSLRPPSQSGLAAGKGAAGAGAPAEG